MEHLVLYFLISTFIGLATIIDHSPRSLEQLLKKLNWFGWMLCIVFCWGTWVLAALGYLGYRILKLGFKKDP